MSLPWNKVKMCAVIKICLQICYDAMVVILFISMSSSPIQMFPCIQIVFYIRTQIFYFKTKEWQAFFPQVYLNTWNWSLCLKPHKLWRCAIDTHRQWMDSTAHGDLYKKCKKKGKFIKKDSHNSWNSYIPSWLKTILTNSKKKTYFCSKRIWGIFCATFKQTFSICFCLFSKLEYNVKQRNLSENFCFTNFSMKESIQKKTARRRPPGPFKNSSLVEWLLLNQGRPQ